MTDESDSLSEEERSLFRPFTRESLKVIEARIAEEQAKQKELERKRAEGEVRLSLKFCIFKMGIPELSTTYIQRRYIFRYVFFYSVLIFFV